jgi:hypothetical protein
VIVRTILWSAKSFLLRGLNKTGRNESDPGGEVGLHRGLCTGRLWRVSLRRPGHPMKTVPAGNSFRIKKFGRPVRPADAVASENSRSAILQRLVDGVLLFGHLSPAARYIEIDIADIRIGDSRCGSITLLRPPSKSIGSLAHVSKTMQILRSSLFSRRL